MEKRKHPLNPWAIAGCLLSLCVLAVLVLGLNSSPKVLVNTADIIRAAEEMLECARSGDYDALGQMLYGAPNLGAGPERGEDAESMIWYAYLDSIAYEFPGECYALDSGVALETRVRCLDINALTETLEAIAPELLMEKASGIEDELEIYDETHTYRPEFIGEVLREAAARVLAEDPAMLEQEITLPMMRVEGRWQVVPTEALQQLLSGSFRSEGGAG